MSMVYMIFGTGFEETEAVAPIDCLRRAGVTVCTLGIGGREIVSSHGIPMLADAVLEELTPEQREKADMVILPGGLGGVNACRGSKEAMELLKWAGESGRYVAAICAGPTVLGDLGLLEDRNAVCYPGMEDGMPGAIACRGSQTVVDGHIVTAEAAGSALHFGLTLVRLLKGREAAGAVARSVHYHGEL